MAGALILARAVSDERLSDLILKSTAKRVIKRAKVAPSRPPFLDAKEVVSHWNREMLPRR